MSYPVLISQNTSISCGHSKEADLVSNFLIEELMLKIKTATYSYAVHQLENLSRECSSDNWDGYGASPIQKDAYNNALILLTNLPYYLIPSLDIIPEPDGHISFEWYNKPSHLVSISVSPDGYLHYAALIGTKKRYGSQPLTEEIPYDMLEIINQVIKG